jgi:hypothetical protein
MECIVAILVSLAYSERVARFLLDNKGKDGLATEDELKYDYIFNKL